MTQEIKKYRRKVSNERVERAAIALYEAYDMPKRLKMSLQQWESKHDRCGISYLLQARIILEADAEVIEAKALTHPGLGVTLSINNILFGYFNSEKEFHDTWEEI